MRDISKMPEDLEAAMKLHAAKALESTRAVADKMAEAARKYSSPMYGMVVDAKVVKGEVKSTVQVNIRATGSGIGVVYGGEASVTKQVKNEMDNIARTEGLDEAVR